MNLIRTDAQLVTLRNSLGDHKTPVFYSTLADNAGGLQEPLTGCVLISPMFDQERPELLRALLARELGRASNRQRTRRWRIAVSTLAGCVVTDILLIYAALPPVLRVIDAVLATTFFWVALWLFRTLYSPAMLSNFTSTADAWAQTRVPNYEHLKAELMARRRKTPP
ncbi:MAG: hypothetical protein ACYCXG_12165 [Acidiferrobacter sp.]